MYYINSYPVRDKRLDDIVMEYKRVMITFTGNRCFECRVFEPVINKTLIVLGKKLYEEKREIVEKYDIIQHVMVDIDKNKYWIAKFDISTIPYMILYLNGEIVYEKAGFEPKLTDVCLDLWKI